MAAMRRIWLLLAILAACADVPTFEQVAATLPPLPANEARIFVYREHSTYQSLAWVPVFFNRETIGAVGPGHVLMRDVPPGTYRIEAKSEGLWPEQAKTVTVTAGETVYAKITSFKSEDPTGDGDGLISTFVVTLIDPAIGRREITTLWYTAAARAIPAG